MFLAIIVFLLSLSTVVNSNIVQVNRSPITFPIARRINLTSIHNLVQHDQTRAKLLRTQGVSKASGGLKVDAAVINSPATNLGVDYVVSIGIGIPPTSYTLVVDTGSSIIVIDNSTKPYVKTGTSVAEPNTVSVVTGLGSFSGKEFLDTVTITSTLVVKNQAICVASGLDGLDGIFGLGPSDLTVGTLSPATTSVVPTIVDNAFSEGLIAAHEISIAFQPTHTSESTNGVLTWGGTDTSNVTGTISYSPITTVAPSNEFWGINQSIRYGASTILSQTAGIVDTSTTLILIATNAFDAYKSAVGGVLDTNTGLLRITSTQFSALKSLFFKTSSGLFELTANAQIWPRALNTLIGGTSGKIYLIVNDIGSDSGSGLDFINGQTFLERFYLVLDTANQRVGLANTTYTHATTN